jgi:excisionase family DNA binding protein
MALRRDIDEDVDNHAPSRTEMVATPNTHPETARGEKEVSVQAYTVEQVAEILQIGRDKVYALIRTGRLHSIKIDKLRRITDQQLADFVASLDENASKN